MTTQTQHDLAPANQPEFELTVTPVPDEQRIDFWPQYFGAIPQWLLLEPHIFAWMDRFCEGYSGGIYALCIADNIKLEYQEVTDPYTKEKYFEYAHDGKLMGQLLIPSNPDNQE